MPINPTNRDIALEIINHTDYNDVLLYHIFYDCFYFFKGGYWEIMSEREITILISNFIGSQYPKIKITMAQIFDIKNFLKIHCLRQIEEEEDQYIAFKDRLLNTNTMNTIPFDKEKLCVFHVPYNYEDIKINIPNWERFLQTSLVMRENVIEPDIELISLAQEMFGYFFSSSKNLQNIGTAWFLIGDGSNGKTIMLNRLEDIFRKRYCSSFTIQALTVEQFNLPGIINKKINISNEDESKYIRSDKFKALITGQMVQTARKFGQSFEFSPKTKYAFASNKLLSFETMDYALKRRIKILPFFRRFLPHEKDFTLEAKLKLETAGIIGWALEGLKRLQRNNYIFSEAKATNQALKEFESETSSAIRFIEENYLVTQDEDVGVINDYLYSTYKNWCEKNGKKPLSSFNFQGDIARNIDGIKLIRLKNPEGKRMYARNFVLKEDEEEEIDISKLLL